VAQKTLFKITIEVQSKFKKIRVLFRVRNQVTSEHHHYSRPHFFENSVTVLGF
jgi:hypothetical protein